MSTWRKYPKNVAGLERSLLSVGIEPRDALIGKTPILPNQTRGDEVTAWLQENEVLSYVCIDDEADFGDHPLVRTSYSNGLTAADVGEAVKILWQ